MLADPEAAVLGVYLLPVDATSQERPGVSTLLPCATWTSSTKRSPRDHLSLNGRWLHKEKFVELSYHPDMSLKTFGLQLHVERVGDGHLDREDCWSAAAAARTSIAAVPSAEKRQLEAATTQLDLLKTASEFEVLSATRARAAEVAVLEQKVKLAGG